MVVLGDLWEANMSASQGVVWQNLKMFISDMDMNTIQSLTTPNDNPWSTCQYMEFTQNITHLWESYTDSQTYVQT